MKRQQRTVGAIVRVPLDGRFWTYALILPEIDFAFFDARTAVELPLNEIICRPILFRVGVHKYGVTRGQWQKVGEVAIPPKLAKPLPTFIQDAFHPEQFSIYLGGNIRPAKRSECVGLERCAVWTPQHVKDRLRDHYAGKINKWVESLRIR